MYKETVKTRFEVEKELPNIIGQMRVLDQKYCGFVNVNPQIQLFKKQLQSLTQFTYRETFLQPISSAPEIKTDAGWSCMHRTGQMLIMEALKRHIFGHEFSIDFLNQNPKMLQRYLSLLKEFEDSHSAKLSLHNLCHEGSLQAGRWIGPNAISFALKYVIDKNQEIFE